ncbi:flagella basal body P-ring formation protein FlgA [Sphingomonas sanguinis]|uniref:flagella basal body P-ring formation protein FlgA n=1 Tax=Sphingomonas sp. LC-1 TaxID=3110957 RepID=UPI0021BB3D4D|nr:flagella basal body P-ring formation protein FlgA [Sphingomonas sp. LC-1]MCT8001134.1 flagella basal body P-ring formation protein FlgA [Sphingomonas sp. LC-1]
MILSLLLAGAAGFQDVAALDAAVTAFTGRPVGVEGGPRSPIDSRLKLAQCPTVSLSWRTEAHDAVVVACSTPQWRIFVPVLAPPRAVAAIAAAPAVAVRQEPVIRRGDPVTVEAGSDGFSITRDGIAMADAVPGAHFPVRIDASRQPIQAVALSSGRATLPGWTE